MPSTFDDILSGLPEIENKAKQMKETLLANLAMVGEIPAPTFGENERIIFLMNRFKNAAIQHQSIDELGNGVGIVKGSGHKGNILLVAHADTVFDRNTDYTVKIQPGEVTGPGVADNSLGLSMLLTLPLLLQELDITFEHNLILVGAIRSLGRGNLEGLRFFLSNFNRPVTAGMVLEGVELGRLSHISIGMRRGVISCNIPEEYDWTRFGAASSILTINDIINQINEIRIPKRPRTSIILGSIEGGRSFTTAKWAALRFEIRSESSEMVEELEQNIKEIINETSTRTGDTIELDIFAERQPGGLAFSHPLVEKTGQIIEAIDVEPRPGPSTSELSAFTDLKIPAITLGLSHGSHVRRGGESVQIEPIYKGIAQTIATLQAIDRGYCEES
jgi:acetylornithine deacetylase/succinyl-diaminopimelate desuccinylase-like protein